jgi:hypothetical protein
MDQRRLASMLSCRLPEYKSRHPEAVDAWEGLYPDFRGGMYQPVLAELLLDRGWSVVSTLSAEGPAGRARREKSWETLRRHLLEGHRAVLHIPGHYLAALAFDAAQDELLFADPRMPERRLRVAAARLVEGSSFHRTPGGEQRPGWIGRALIVWPGPRPAPGECPCCRGVTPRASHPYCRACGCFIDRRASTGVQRALDAFAEAAPAEDPTAVSAARLRAAAEELSSRGAASTPELRTALLHYPLRGHAGTRGVCTLARHAAQRGLDLAPLSGAELERIVAAGDSWEGELNRLLAGRQ